MATRVYKPCQSTTTTGPSLGSSIALQNVVGLVDFPINAQIRFRCAVEILAATALFTSPGQREVDPSVHSNAANPDATSLQTMPLVSV